MNRHNTNVPISAVTSGNVAFTAWNNHGARQSHSWLSLTLRSRGWRSTNLVMRKGRGIELQRTYDFFTFSGEKVLYVLTGLALGVRASLSSLEITMGLEKRIASFSLSFFIPGLRTYGRISSSSSGSDLTTGAWLDSGRREVWPDLEILIKLVLAGLLFLNIGWASEKNSTRKPSIPFMRNGARGVILTVLCHVQSFLRCSTTLKENKRYIKLLKAKKKTHGRLLGVAGKDAGCSSSPWL